MNDVAQLAAFRKLMLKHEIDAYIIPSSDPHQSEYVADYWKSREWISGFDGSAGTAVITKNHAGLWTDSRYFIQAEQQLADSEFVLHKVYDRLSPSFSRWLRENLAPGATVGIDGWVFSKSQEESLRKQFSANEINLITHIDLVNQAWQERPNMPKKPIFVHSIDFAGQSVKDKIQQVRVYLKEENAQFHLITALDEISWVLNIRSSDVECNPVSITYLLIGQEEIYLFVDEDKIIDIKDHLSENNITPLPYDTIKSQLEELKDSNRIILSKALTNISLYDSLPSSSIVSKSSYIEELKAIKNEVEIGHIRKAMVQDGVALVKAFHWLDTNIDKQEITEFQFREKLRAYRSESEYYRDESFGAIVGYKGNGAIVHYSPDSKSSAIIKRDGILLCDSGGQYLNGTTDITRTIALSPPDEDQKKANTLVLKGHIDLDMAVYPENTTGGQLDVLARMPLWQHGLNFLHGTGHGVGFFLNVHEGPHGFAPSCNGRAKKPLKHGMITSNEPGFYLEEQFGIRIENLILTKNSTKEGFLEHETLTLYPIDKSLVDPQYLEEKHISWLNEYHKKVWNSLSPHLNDELKSWLEPQCSPL